MLAYVGPETVAPIASALAAIVGGLLIGWRWISDKVKRMFRLLFRMGPPTEPPTGEVDARDPAQERT